LPKKIEFDLLLADLALKFGNPRWRRNVTGSNLACPFRHTRRDNAGALARSTQRSQGLRPARPKQIAPRIEILAQHIQLL
jgi:hypothetical protein